MNDLFRIINAASLSQLAALFLTCFVVIYKWMYEHKEKQETARKKKIGNLVEAFSEGKAENNAYIIEQLFLDRYGALLNFKEIKYFLRQENPSYLILHYVNSRNWLKFNERSTHLISKGFFRGKRLNVLIWFTNIAFSLCGAVGIISFISSAVLYFEGSSLAAVFQVVGLSAVFFLYAWLFYLGAHSAESAIKLKHITKTSSRDATNGAA